MFRQLDRMSNRLTMAFTLAHSDKIESRIDWGFHIPKSPLRVKQCRVIFIPQGLSRPILVLQGGYFCYPASLEGSLSSGGPANRFRSLPRALAKRDMTVPTGQSRTRAISE